jgi:hypothetical protein
MFFHKLGNHLIAIKGKDGSVFVWNTIPCEEETAKSLEQIGKVKYVYCPSIWHDTNPRQWKSRFPDAKILCPKSATVVFTLFFFILFFSFFILFFFLICFFHLFFFFFSYLIYKLNIDCNGRRNSY